MNDMALNRLAERAVRGGPARRRLHDRRLALRPAAAGEDAAGLVRVGLPNQDADELLVDLADAGLPAGARGAGRSSTRRGASSTSTSRASSTEFDLPLDWQLSDGLPPRVLRAIARIPYGETRNYTRDGDAAPATSARSAPPAPPAARNPIPLVVPCHRVLRSGGAPRRLRRRPADEGGRCCELEGVLDD